MHGILNDMHNQRSSPNTKVLSPHFLWEAVVLLIISGPNKPFAKDDDKDRPIYHIIVKKIVHFKYPEFFFSHFMQDMFKCLKQEKR